LADEEDGGDDPEERKETEQMPLTKDFIVNHLAAHKLAREAFLFTSGSAHPNRESSLLFEGKKIIQVKGLHS
jgi:hypothetical protein